VLGCGLARDPTFGVQTAEQLKRVAEQRAIVAIALRLFERERAVCVAAHLLA
jgi:hypothetical protein